MNNRLQLLLNSDHNMLRYQGHRITTYTSDITDISKSEIDFKGVKKLVTFKNQII